MNLNKLLNAIGIGFGANKIIKGEALLNAIVKNKVKLVILAIDMGVSQKKKFKDKCNFYNIKCYDDILTKEQIANACGVKTLVAIGFADSNIVALIESNI